MINFETSPAEYRHWKLNIDGAVATLEMDVREDETLSPGYKLKLNSYDLGVDIELADAVTRLRFEHPEVSVVVITSLKPRIFCAGANIYMLGASSMLTKSISVSSPTRRAARSRTLRGIQANAISPRSTAQRREEVTSWRLRAMKSTW